VDNTGFILEHCLRWANFRNSLRVNRWGKSSSGTKRRIRRRRATESLAGLALLAKIKY
jgi:hypothetical protein